MAIEGSVYQRRKDGRWVAQYRDASGKVRYLYRKCKQEAKQALREALTDRDEGIVPPSKMTVGTLLDEWLEDISGDVSRRTWVNQESIVRLHIKSTIGDKKLSRLDPKDVQSLYREKLGEGLCSGTVGRIHAVINQALRKAVHSKYIKTNPIAAVKPPKQQRREIEVLTPEQVRHLLDIVRGDRFEAAYVLGGTCGLRIGEVLRASTAPQRVRLSRGPKRLRG